MLVKYLQQERFVLWGQLLKKHKTVIAISNLLNYYLTLFIVYRIYLQVFGVLMHDVHFQNPSIKNKKMNNNNNNNTITQKRNTHITKYACWSRCWKVELLLFPKAISVWMFNYSQLGMGKLSKEMFSLCRQLWYVY